MAIVKCALGVIQERGERVVNPNVVEVGPDEADFLSGHVEKARRIVSSSARGVFSAGATTPGLLERLVTTADDAEYEAVSKTLQDALASAMKGSTAKDCVFAVVRAHDEVPDSKPHVTLLKLDAVVDAARMELVKGHVTFEVLHELLPEPGRLQKALSWPDPRATSQVIMHDTNFSHAQYFERACQADVSKKSTETEAQLAEAIYDAVPLESVPDAIERAADLSGTLDEVLTTLSEDFPQLADPAAEVATAERPPGIVRPNKVRTQRLVWRADGVELRVPPELAGSVFTERRGNVWRLSVDTPSEPVRGQ
jgi:hypothetical protein